MNEQFDRNLRNHIRDTFDHYDDLMADDGWAKFKQQKNKKRGLIFWYGLPSGIAAALALLWLFSTNTTDLVKKERINVVQNKVKQLPENFSKKTKPGFESIELIANQGNSTSTASVEKENKQQVNHKPVVIELSGQAEDISRPRLSQVNTHQINTGQLETNYTLPIILADNDSFTAENSKSVDSGTTLAFNPSLLNAVPISNKPSSKEDAVIKKQKNKTFNFAIDANTFYSFTSAGVNNDLSIGIGVLSELKLSKNLRINSGISINRQSAVYQNSQQGGASQNFSSKTSPNDRVSSLTTQSISIPEDIKTSAKLVGFDIPLNLKYNIAMGKAKTFITTGISSYSLLNQSYVNDLSVINYSLKSEPTTTVLRNVDKEKEDPFSNFQFARTVNFSFGILYPLSSKNSISVEPFVKYPITGFGSQNLEIGSGGISFKLNFGK